MAERNECFIDLARKYGFKVNVLHSISKEIPNSLRNKDGIHYLTDGANVFAQTVARIIQREK